MQIDQLSNVTSSPGVYLMKDARGNIIYIGKARNLKKRLTTYFGGSGHTDAKTGVLVDRIESFETIVTGNEKEAVILESNLIKKHRPRYNVVLKDDKRYPSLRLDLNHPYPNLTIVRKPKKDGARYFGPYSSALAVRQTLKLINKTFKIRKCNPKVFKNRSRPCLNYQIGRCLGPCCLPVDKNEYDRAVSEVIMFLKGRTSELIKKVREEMGVASVNRDFEKAAALRDKMFALEKTLEKQVSVTTDFKDRDVFAMAGRSLSCIITVMSVHRGFLQDTRHYDFAETLATESEALGTFIRQYYAKNESMIPTEILVPVEMEDADLTESWLKSLGGKNVRIYWPKRGEKARLLNMAVLNAENELKERSASAEYRKSLLYRLHKKLKTEKIPFRIECFDNSNISGKVPVSAMVAFENGEPDKSTYRKYRIKTVDEPNDYKTMAEVIGRRFDPEKSDALPYPDLVVVDGGRGQLNIARSILKEMGMDQAFDIVGIAKPNKFGRFAEEEDKVYLAGRLNPVDFSKDKDLLLFLMRIRDEAHRFAIAYHRKKRGVSAVKSSLDAIPGIGKKRKKMLLSRFGSVKKIREASVEELCQIPGIHLSIAQNIKSELNRS